VDSLGLVWDYDPAVLALLPDGDLRRGEVRVREGPTGIAIRSSEASLVKKTVAPQSGQKRESRIAASSSEWRTNSLEWPVMVTLCAGKRAW
jgi:hypothetical protein